MVQLCRVNFDGDTVKLKIRGLEAPVAVSGIREEGDPGRRLPGAAASTRRVWAGVARQSGCAA